MRYHQRLPHRKSKRELMNSLRHHQVRMMIAAAAVVQVIHHQRQAHQTMTVVVRRIARRVVQVQITTAVTTTTIIHHADGNLVQKVAHHDLPQNHHAYGLWKQTIVRISHNFLLFCFLVYEWFHQKFTNLR